MFFWVFMKNISGVWFELFDGWYLDFVGWLMFSVFVSYGYDKLCYVFLQFIMEFLYDMFDIVVVSKDDLSFWVWIGLYDDFIVVDVILFGVFEIIVQYDFIKEEYECVKWYRGVVKFVYVY